MKTPMVVAAICRWTGRILGVALVSIGLVIAIGEGMPNPFTQPAAVAVGFAALAAVLGGILVGCFREGVGGIVSLAGWVTFIFAVGNRIPRPGTFVALLAVPGALFLVSALIRRRRQRSPKSD